MLLKVFTAAATLKLPVHPLAAGPGDVAVMGLSIYQSGAGVLQPGFIELQERIGAVTLMNYVKAFGFGQKTGIDIIGEGTNLFSPQQYGPVEAALLPLGRVFP